MLDAVRARHEACMGQLASAGQHGQRPGQRGQPQQVEVDEEGEDEEAAAAAAAAEAEAAEALGRPQGEVEEDGRGVSVQAVQRPVHAVQAPLSQEDGKKPGGGHVPASWLKPGLVPAIFGISSTTTANRASTSTSAQPTSSSAKGFDVGGISGMSSLRKRREPGVPSTAAAEAGGRWHALRPFRVEASGACCPAALALPLVQRYCASLPGNNR